METNSSENVDLLLRIDPHGWSSCTFLQKGHIVTLSASFLFGDPFEILITALSQLDSGSPEASFDWYDEPGGYRFTFRKLTSNERISLQIDRFDESYGYNPQPRDRILEATLPLSYWIVLYYLQLKKLACLLQDRTYAQNRQVFPFKLFRSFEALVLHRYFR
ncbi:hypothetical protein [Taibaiella koreensis]|uniref:hypothetical protein n=1 Tax=Taibaiella koreensis TaxID=1268548 RepID=UPI000E59E3B3|nr:hypothetical protein [Taibaiella koreensis]